jgi:hypothetical protein
MIEEWKDIPGYEGRYQASTLGSIRGLDRYVRHNYGGLKMCKGKELKPMKQNNGYLSVWIEGKTKSIHRLVAQTFLIDETNQYKVVEHINHNRHDNRVDNLLWSNQTNNMRRMVSDGRWNNQYTI